MASTVVLLVIAAFLSGAVIIVFALLVVGVHAGDRPRHLTAGPPRGQLESLTRTILGVGLRTGDRPGGLTDARLKQIPGLCCHSGRDSAACHFGAIRLSDPKEWSRRDRNHAPGIPHSD